MFTPGLLLIVKLISQELCCFLDRETFGERFGEKVCGMVWGKVQGKVRGMAQGKVWGMAQGDVWGMAQGKVCGMVWGMAWGMVRGKGSGKDLCKRFLEKVREMVWRSSLLVPYAQEGDQGVAKLSLTRFK